MNPEGYLRCVADDLTHISMLTQAVTSAADRIVSLEIHGGLSVSGTIIRNSVLQSVGIKSADCRKNTYTVSVYFKDNIEEFEKEYAEERFPPGVVFGIKNNFLAQVRAVSHDVEFDGIKDAIIEGSEILIQRSAKALTDRSIEAAKSAFSVVSGIVSMRVQELIEDLVQIEKWIDDLGLEVLPIGGSAKADIGPSAAWIIVELNLSEGSHHSDTIRIRVSSHHDEPETRVDAFRMKSTIDLVGGDRYLMKHSDESIRFQGPLDELRDRLGVIVEGLR